MSGEASGVGRQLPVGMSGDLYDLRAIFMLRAALAGLDPAGTPAAVVAVPPRPAPPPGADIAILAGSFDPLTNAHLALAQAARGHPGQERNVYLALSRHTVDKEARVRPTDADRALVLAQWAGRAPGCGVLFFNRGLYADQAVAARAAFPAARSIAFVVGFDKARQIFDPRYYTDRDAALRTLFANVTLLVAPRADAGPGALDALLDRPENRPFRDAAWPLPLDPAWADDSSTRVREAARQGRPYADLVPPETVAFVNDLQPYAPPGDLDRYALREALIAALEPERAWAEARADLRALVAATVAPDAAGERLRAWLVAAPGERRPATLRELLGT